MCLWFDRAQLQKVKTVMRLAIHTVYATSLEISLLNDQKCTFPNECLTTCICVCMRKMYVCFVKTAETDQFYDKIQRENKDYGFLSTSPFVSNHGWKRELMLSRRKKYEQTQNQCFGRFPHLRTFPYNHHGLGPDMNELGNWDPFLPNTDNPWLCQSLLVSHCRVASNGGKPAQCFPPKLKLTDYYTDLDVSLGQYLNQLFEFESCPNERCKENLLGHKLTYSHNDGRLLITVKQHYSTADSDLIAAETAGGFGIPIHQKHDSENQRIVMWSFCNKCKRIVTPLVAMSDATFDISFGKYLELTFYRHKAICRTGGCTHEAMQQHTRCFGYQNLVIQFQYQKQKPYQVITSRQNSVDWKLQHEYFTQEINVVTVIAQYALAGFLRKIEKLREWAAVVNEFSDDLNRIEKEVLELQAVEFVFVVVVLVVAIVGWCLRRMCCRK